MLAFLHPLLIRCAPGAGRSTSPRLLGLRLPYWCAIWLALVATGLCWSIDTESRPAVHGETPLRWPAMARLTAPHLEPVLLLFLHPHCPCSRASVESLKYVIQHTSQSIRTEVVFFSSRKFDKPLEETKLWKRVHQIPGVHVVIDEQGRLAREFGARASGWVAVYDRDQRLQFAGGITKSRGKCGSNAGLRAIAAYLEGSTVEDRNHCVFGCPLYSQSETEEGTVR